MCECGSKREIRIDAKCNDMCAIMHVPPNYHEGGEAIQRFGYVPRNLGIGGGDYVRLRICLDCRRAIGLPQLEDEEVLEAISKM